MERKPLKVDLHMHAGGDPEDNLPYSPEDLIDVMAAKGFDAIAITNHNRDMYRPELEGYAASRGVILIRGLELTYERQHIVLLNFDAPSEIQSPDDILARKSKENLVIAAHPYFPFAPSCGPLLDTRPEVFDAVEFSHMYITAVNFNRRAILRAGELGLPLIGTSDAHSLYQAGYTYTLVDADDRTPESIISAIKAGKIELVTRPLPLARFARTVLGMKMDEFARKTGLW